MEAVMQAKLWRPRPESNRGARIFSPLRHHSATWPILKPLIRDRPPPLSICVTQFRRRRCYHLRHAGDRRAHALVNRLLVGVARERGRSMVDFEQQRLTM